MRKNSFRVDVEQRPIVASIGMPSDVAIKVNDLFTVEAGTVSLLAGQILE